MDHDIRQMLRDRADDVAPSFPTLPTTTLSRARRSRVSTVVASAMTVAVLLAGSVAIADRLRHGGRSINPTARFVKSKLSLVLPEEPRDVAYGAGALWVASNHSLFELDPTNGRIRKSWPFPLSGYPRPPYVQKTIAVTRSAVWVVLAADGVKRTEVAPVQTRSCDSQGHCHAGMSLSVGEGPKPKNFKDWWALFRVDFKTGKAFLGVKSYTSDVGSISAGPTGVWVGATESSNPFKGSFYRFDGTTGHLLAQIEAGGSPMSMSATSNRVLAVVQTRDNPNFVALIDPLRKRVSSPIYIHDAQTIAEIGGNAWILEHSQSSKALLIRLSLPSLRVTGEQRIPFDPVDFGFAAVTSADGPIWVSGGFPVHFALIDPSTLRVASAEGDGVAEHAVATPYGLWAVEPSPGQHNLHLFTVSDVVDAQR